VAQNSFIHSGNFYSGSSSTLLLRGVPDYTALILCQSYHAEASQATVSEGLEQRSLRGG